MRGLLCQHHLDPLWRRLCLQTLFYGFQKLLFACYPVWLGLLAAGFILAADLFFWYHFGGFIGKVMLLVSLAIAILLWVWSLWIFPVFAKFTEREKNF